MKSRRSGAALFVLGLVILACVFLPFLLRQGPDVQNLDEASQSMSARHVFGTDHLGRDLLARTLEGGRISLFIGILASLVSVGFGAGYGALASLWGGKRGEALMRLVDVVYALPDILIIILFMTYMGRSLAVLILAMALVSWLGSARLVYGLVRVLREADFVAAARLSGASTARIILRHIFPNLAGPLAAQATLTVPGVMMTESFLSFLGLGVQAPQASWGSLIQEGAQGMEVYPWMLVFPALVFGLTLLAANLLGDSLHERFKPRISE